MHTSTVTVAVFNMKNQPKAVSFDPADFKVEWYSGTGAGGQHRNKHQNSARITHLPTGLQETAQCRSRENSKNEAMSKLTARITEMHNAEAYGAMAADRKRQVGSGMRGDKIRTYRYQDDVIIDHRTNQKFTFRQYEQGKHLR